MAKKAKAKKLRKKPGQAHAERLLKKLRAFEEWKESEKATAESEDVYWQITDTLVEIAARGDIRTATDLKPPKDKPIATKEDRQKFWLELANDEGQSNSLRANARALLIKSGGKHLLEKKN